MKRVSIINYQRESRLVGARYNCTGERSFGVYLVKRIPIIVRESPDN